MTHQHELEPYNTRSRVDSRLLTRSLPGTVFNAIQNTILVPTRAIQYGRWQIQSMCCCSEKLDAQQLLVLRTTVVDPRQVQEQVQEWTRTTTRWNFHLPQISSCFYFLISFQVELDLLLFFILGSSEIEQMDRLWARRWSSHHSSISHAYSCFWYTLGLDAV